MPKVYIIDDEEEMCLSLSELLTQMNYDVEFSTNPQKALRQIMNNPPDFVITDIQMPGENGINLLKQIKKLNKQIHIIVMTGYPSVERAVEAMKYGALDFLSKPLKHAKLLENLDKYSNTIPVNSNNETQNKCKSLEMVNIYETAGITAKSNASVIITGESGTGKEHIANLIHNLSSRRDKPFIKVNSAAISETLLESELFGHERGAFTGANVQLKGKFELANNGTLFFDEIGDMSLKTQAKILRVIQEQEFSRLGGTKVLRTDIRFVAATNKNLEELIRKGLFREDLYYRLSVVTLEIPPLRDRIEDLEILIDFFKTKFCNQYGKSIDRIDNEVINTLSTHTWPGNIRELRNCIERAVIFCQNKNISMNDLSSQYTIEPKTEENTPEVLINELTKEIIVDALTKTNGSRQKAADLLNIHRKTLYNKMKKLGISV